MSLISTFYELTSHFRQNELEEYKDNATDIQNEQMFDLLREAENTELGKKYDFANIFSYQDFKEKIPFTTDSDLIKYKKRIEKGEKNIFWPSCKTFIKTKEHTEIPISTSAIKETFLQGIIDSSILYRISHKDFSLSGPEVFVGLKGEDDICKDISILIKDITFREDLNVYLDNPGRILEKVKGKDIKSYIGTPESMIEFINCAQKDLPGIKEEPATLFHCGTALSKDIEKYKSLLPENISYQAIYLSPEGIMGIQDTDGSSYLLMIDLSIFYEFIDSESEDKTPKPIDGVELNKTYQIIITNNSGLWRYPSKGPKMKFISLNPYKFLLV